MFISTKVIEIQSMIQRQKLLGINAFNIDLINHGNLYASQSVEFHIR